MRLSKNAAGVFALALSACAADPVAAPEASEPGTGAWNADGGALAKLSTPCTFDNGTAKKFTVTLVDGESALISVSAKGALQVNGDNCTTTETRKSVAKAIDVKLADGFAPDGRGVRVLLDYSGGPLVMSGATTAPVSVTLGGRPQDEVWVRTTSKPDFVNVTAAGVVSVGTAVTNTKKDIALTKVGGLSLFLGAGADVVSAGAATLPISAYGSADNDIITTGSGADLLDGGPGDDVLTGGAGEDTLVGGDGDDTLDGQGGCDAYDGGAGVDTNLDDQPAAKVEGVEADFAKGYATCLEWCGDGIVQSWEQCDGGDNCTSSCAVIDSSVRLISRQKPATQSSTLGDEAVAAKAVDGDYGGVGYVGYQHTADLGRAWWRVDLGASYHIDKVDVWNRADCCQFRVAGFDVEVSDDDIYFSSIFYAAEAAGRPSSYLVDARGRYVRIRLRTAGIDLNMAEVEVFGY